MKSRGQQNRRLPYLNLVLLSVVLSSCDVKNDNAVTCRKKDCTAACVEKGFETGRCDAASGCVCGPRPTNGDPHEWDNGEADAATSDTHTDEETIDMNSTDTISETNGSDTDTDATTKKDAGPDSGE